MSIYIIIGILVCIGVALFFVIIKQKKRIIHLEEEKNFKCKEQEALEKKLEYYHKKDNATDQFFSIVTHDLRGPVGNTASILQTMLDNPGIYDEETTSEILLALKDSAKQSLDLLTTLSQWSRLQRNKTKTHIEVFTIVDVVENAISKVKNYAGKKNISINVEYRDQNPTLSSDMALISVMLQHLLINAIKFSNPGNQVSVFISATDKGIQFQVEDNGIGIAKEDQPRVMDTEDFFFTYGTDNEKGPGLGLTVVQEYAKLLNGKVWFASKKDEGSDFYILLPNIVS